MEEGLREGQAFKDEVVIMSATSSQTDKPPQAPQVCAQRHTQMHRRKTANTLTSGECRALDLWVLTVLLAHSFAGSLSV